MGLCSFPCSVPDPRSNGSPRNRHAPPILRALGRGSSMSLSSRRPRGLVWNFGLDELCQLDERLLPAELAGVDGDHVGDALLHDAQLGTAGHLPQVDRGVHLAGHTRVVEPLRVTDALMRYELTIRAAEGVASARREVRERHLEGAAGPRVQVVDPTRESVRRKPFGRGIRIEEGAIQLLRLRAQHAVQPNYVEWHGESPFAGAFRAPTPTSRSARRRIDNAGFLR